MKVEVCLQVGTDVVDTLCPDQAAFEVWVSATLAALAQAAANVPTKGVIGVRLVSPDESTELNQHYRGKNAPTNVLAFPAGPQLIPDTEMDEPELGDLVLCMDVARDEAQAQGKTLSQHIAHLTVHGTLHLLGYDHGDDTEATRMESLERSILERLGLPDPYKDDAA